MMDSTGPAIVPAEVDLKFAVDPEARSAAAKGPSGRRRRINLGHIHKKRRFAIADPHDIQERLLSRRVLYDFVVGCASMIDRRGPNN